MKLKFYEAGGSSYGSYFGSGSSLRRLWEGGLEYHFNLFLSDYWTYDMISVVISTKTGFLKWIPIADCDDPYQKTRAETFLDKCGIGYITLESSSGRYWLFLDRIGSFSNGMQLLRQVPGRDIKYLEFCQTLGKFVVRAFPKDLRRPKVIKWNSSNMELRKWMDCFLRYWDRPILEEVYLKRAECRILGSIK